MSGKPLIPIGISHHWTGGEEVRPTVGPQGQSSPHFTSSEPLLSSLLGKNKKLSLNKLHELIRIEKGKRPKEQSLKSHRKTITMQFQNIRGANAEWKSKFIVNEVSQSNGDIFAFSETNTTAKLIKSLKCQIKNAKMFQCCKESGLGKGIIVFVKYPLAKAILNLWTLDGRIINIVLQGKKKKNLSIYAIQAPTAPYSDSKEETRVIADKLAVRISNDIMTRRSFILFGDTNSYPNSNLDYRGPTGGQNPSEIIETLEGTGLIDIFRHQNAEKLSFSFKNGIMEARLDQYWISPELCPSILDTSIEPIEASISDHSCISLAMTWKTPKPACNEMKTFWPKSSDAIEQWKDKMQEKLGNLDFDATSERGFAKDFKYVAKTMKKALKQSKQRLHCLKP